MAADGQYAGSLVPLLHSAPSESPFPIQLNQVLVHRRTVEKITDKRSQRGQWKAVREVHGGAV